MPPGTDTAPLHIETPLLKSKALSALSGKTVLLKMESHQPAGSFKIRGIGLACQEYASRGARRFISSSGGNAGIAVACAGGQLGIPVTVVVPESASERAKARIRQEGAEVIVHGASWYEANALAQSMIAGHDAFLHPFDDPLLWRGHASMIDEIARTGVRPGVVVLSVGGGGLLCGVVEGLIRNGLESVPVVAVETLGADSLAQSLAAGQRVTLDAISSIATSLGARQVCEHAFTLASSYPVTSVVVSDRAAVAACLAFLGDQRELVEPACGASLAVAYQRHPALENFDNILVIVCGGTTVAEAQLDSWAKSLPE